MSVAADVAYSCVVDDVPAIWASVIPWLATAIAPGAVPPSCLHLHHVCALRPDLAALCASLGVQTHRIAPFDPRFPHTNKIRQCATDFGNVRRVVLTDVDVAFAQPLPLQTVRAPAAGKLVDLPNPPLDILRAVFAAAGVAAGAPLDAAQAGLRFRTLPANFNGGLYILERTQLDRLGEAWARWARWLIAHVGLLQGWAVHVDQVSFCLAVHELQLPSERLSDAWNFPLHMHATADQDPCFLLHHHAALDASQRLKPNAWPGVNAAVTRANQAIETFARAHLRRQPVESTP